MPKIEVPAYIKGLIFDCDGTLVDSMPLHWIAWEKAVVLKGGFWRPEFFSSTKGMPEEDIVALYNERFALNLDPVDTVRIKHEYFRSQSSRLRPVPPVLDVVRRYSGRLPMAVASGGVRENVMLELETLDIRHFFQAILTADDDVRPKPSPDIFLEAAKRIDVSPENCQVFEDGDLGLEAARAAGMLPTDIRKYEGREG
jgi:beta-phosphoglucomutase-like phosphatase (HAD superfamily)